MIKTGFIVLAVTVLVFLLLFLTVLLIRRLRFRPTPSKAAQLASLNHDLEPVGFAYARKGDYFYSLLHCWQREMGYCRLYDEGAVLFHMIMDCEPITFSYAGRRWLIELWKGQYGITTGAEIGIYSTTRADITDARFTGTFYETISDAELLPISFVLRKNNRVLLRRSAVHWWLTAFRLGEFSALDTLTMDASITFPNREMRNAFVGGLRQLGYRTDEYRIRRRTVTVFYTKPHAPQPLADQTLQAALVQRTNEANCQLYQAATAPYTDTLDRLEYIKAMVPELYALFIDSIYAKGLYDAFDWISELLHDKRQEQLPPAPPMPHPAPPQPVPPAPCPPSQPLPPAPCPPSQPLPPAPCPPPQPVPPAPCPPSQPLPPAPPIPHPAPSKPVPPESAPPASRPVSPESCSTSHTKPSHSEPSTPCNNSCPSARSAYPNDKFLRQCYAPETFAPNRSFLPPERAERKKQFDTTAS